MTITAQLRSALADRYTIERALGAGGMATVYLAEDVRHHRKVAIKVLHPELSAVLGPERFLKEIQLTANLQHPHILPLFDSGNAEGLLYYVMPYVAGETLRARLEREGQLPVGDAVRIATETADALDYAHRNGVVHRDIKPENILLHDGHVIVADFGIALAVEQAGGVRITQTGLSLGTPQYMAPEQAMGDRQVGPRADVYSLAAVTYEMLAGEPPFTGPNAQAIVAKLITEPPRSVRAARPTVPAPVDSAVARALEKLPADRFLTAKEFSDALDGDGVVPSTSTALGWWRDTRTNPPPTRSVLWPALGGLVTLGMGALLGAAWSARRAPVAPPAHLALALPAEQRLVDVVGSPVAFSRDGRALAYVATSKATRRAVVYYRPLGALEARPLAGTDGAQAPFFSPDGRSIGFTNERVVERATVDGESVTKVFDGTALNVVAAGAAWTPHGEIVVGSERGLWRVPESGGTPRLITRVDAKRGELFHAMPHVLPDGETVAFDIDYAGGADASRVGLVSLRTGKQITLPANARNTIGMLDDHLIVGTRSAAAGTLVAIPFDLKHWRITGNPVPVLDQVAFKPDGGAEASLGDDGSLVYLHGAAQSRLVLVDAHGADVGGPDAVQSYTGPVFAPDGRHIAVGVQSANSGDIRSDVWSYEVASGALSRLTSRVTSWYPAWTPDGRSIVFEAAPENDFTQLWRVPADGSSPEERMYTLPPGWGFRWRPTFTPDGGTMVEEVQSHESAVHELWVIRRAPSGEWQGTRWLRTAFDLENPRLSPDGHWLAYESDETGQFEVYVRAFPGPGSRIQVSSNGGRYPTWSADGRRLYFLPGDMGGRLLTAELRFTPSVQVAARHEAFAGIGATPEVQTGGSPFNGDFDMRPDGNGAVVVRAAGNREVVVVLNWREELRRELARSAR